MKKVLINASNLHVGGGVQVATSFISELPSLLNQLPDCELTVYVSSAVDANLRSMGFSSYELSNYLVFDVKGLEALKRENRRRFSGFDLVFTIFGPLYLPFEIPNHIVGFAQAWVLYPSNEAVSGLPLFKRILLRFKFTAQWLFFKRASRLVVELNHVKERLSSYRAYPLANIDVVNNCFSGIFLDPAAWAELGGLEGNCEVIKLGYVSRAYSHKNIDILLDIAQHLKRISKLKYQFYVTLNYSEWSFRSEGFRNEIVNVGPISAAQCPTFYNAMSGVVFPSLLECFSATPLEAMVMRRPLFASDRGFVRDCCRDHACYFDPLDAEDAAKEIDRWFSHISSAARSANLENAYRYVMSLPRSKDRAEAYLNVINAQLKV